MAWKRNYAGAALTAALALTPGPAQAELICVRVTVIAPVIGTISTNYTCANTPVSTWYRDVGWGFGGFEVLVEIVTPAGGTS